MKYPTKPWEHDFIKDFYYGSTTFQPKKETYFSNNREVRIDLYGTDLVITDFTKSILDVLVEPNKDKLKLKNGESIKSIRFSSNSFDSGNGCCGSYSSSSVEIIFTIDVPLTDKQKEAAEKQYNTKVKEWQKLNIGYKKEKVKYTEAVKKYEEDLKIWKERQKKIREFEKTL